MADERNSRRGRHRDHARQRTPAAGVPVTPPAPRADLSVGTPWTEDFDDLTPPPQLLEELLSDVNRRVAMSPRDQILIAVVAERLLDRIGKVHKLGTDRLLEVAQAAPSSDRTNVRIADLETWRADMVRWRLQLTGIADDNGRLGKLDRTVATLREDVGDKHECNLVRESASTVRTVRNRMLAMIATAATAVGASGYGLIMSRDASRDAAIRSSTRLTARLEAVERDLERSREYIRIVFERMPFLGVPSMPATPTRTTP